MLLRLTKTCIVSIFIFISAISHLWAGINFIDHSPTSSEWQNTTDIVCLITVVDTDNAINTNNITYNISNSGSGLANWHGWRNDAIVDYSYNAKQIRFKITIPSSIYGSTDWFEEGSNNYIQWKYMGEYSNMYNINISINQPPAINFLQPDNNGYASIHPLIEAIVSDEGMGINQDSVTITIDTSQGTNLETIKGSDYPEIYDPVKNLISYNYKKNALETGQRYTATIYAEDLGYTEPQHTTKSVAFTINKASIADLIPYPSPFDPKKESVIIKYVLTNDAMVTINIYDTSKKLVQTIIKETERKAGEHTKDTWAGINYAGQNLANGVYFCEIVAKDNSGTQRRYKSLAIFGK